MGRRDFGKPSPLRAHMIYLLASIPFSVVYSFVEPSQNIFTVAVTIACGYVFVLTALAATRLPTRRMRNFWLCSSVYWLPRRVIVRCGYLGAFLGGLMLADYLWMQPFISRLKMCCLIGI